MSPSYKVEFVKSAKKEFDHLPSKIKERITEALKFLSQNPFSDLLRTKKIKGADHLYRIRIGDYRLVYEIQKMRLLILVIKIGHRKEIYRHF